MYLQLQILYRTTDGRYDTAFCDMDHHRVAFPNDFAQQWVLKNLPEGCSVVRVRMAWAPIPPDEVVMLRIEQATRAMPVSPKEMPNFS